RSDLNGLGLCLRNHRSLHFNLRLHGSLNLSLCRGYRLHLRLRFDDFGRLYHRRGGNGRGDDFFRDDDGRVAMAVAARTIVVAVIVPVPDTVTVPATVSVSAARAAAVSVAAAVTGFAGGHCRRNEKGQTEEFRKMTHG